MGSGLFILFIVLYILFAPRSKNKGKNRYWDSGDSGSWDFDSGDSDGGDCDGGDGGCDGGGD